MEVRQSGTGLNESESLYESVIKQEGPKLTDTDH